MVKDIKLLICGEIGLNGFMNNLKYIYGVLLMVRISDKNSVIL